MNTNESYFKKKFEDCGKFLNTPPTHLISIKYRHLRSRSFYDELLANLNSVKGLTVKDIGHTLNRRGYLLTYGNQSIILVEHETGLEILYIAGSIASLIGLVLQINSMRSNHRRNFDSFPLDCEDVELRYFDDSGKFIEEHKTHYLPYEMFLLLPSENPDIKSMTERIDRLEKEVDKLTKKQPSKRKK